MEDTLLTKAFDVGEIPDDFDPTIVPTTAKEYIQLVKYEASKCPDVVVADMRKKKMKNPVDVSKLINHHDNNHVGKSELAPSMEWQQSQIAMFSDVRRKVELCGNQKRPIQTQLPKNEFEDHWKRICGGSNNPDYKEPTLSLLLSMSERLRIQLLEYHGQWLDDGLALNQGKWIYALLACLNIPLMPETCNTLRILASKCARIRSTKAFKSDAELTALNLIICLVSKYFGQADLGD